MLIDLEALEVQARDLADPPAGALQQLLEVIRGYVRHHEEILEQLPVDQRALVEDASVTVRKARQSVPVAFGRRGEGGHG